MSLLSVCKYRVNFHKFSSKVHKEFSFGNSMQYTGCCLRYRNYKNNLLFELFFSVVFYVQKRKLLRAVYRYDCFSVAVTFMKS